MLKPYEVAVSDDAAVKPRGLDNGRTDYNQKCTTGLDFKIAPDRADAPEETQTSIGT